MEKITFKNGQTPYINDTNLNRMQDNIEKEFEKVKEDTGWVQCTPYSSDIELIDWNPLSYRKIGKILYIVGAVKIKNPTWCKAITQLPFQLNYEWDVICRATGTNNKIVTIATGRDGFLNFLETSVDEVDTSTTPTVFINISIPVEN